MEKAARVTKSLVFEKPTPGFIFIQPNAKRTIWRTVQTIFSSAISQLHCNFNIWRNRSISMGSNNEKVIPISFSTIDKGTKICCHQNGKRVGRILASPQENFSARATDSSR